MQFSIGDRVVHPGIGAGTIIATKRQELIEGFERYYVIEIPTRESTVYIPMRKMDELGIRRVMSQERIGRVFDTLAEEPQPLPKDYKKRQGQIGEKLHSGRPIPIAEAVRDLTGRKQAAYLTRKDAELLSRGRNFLLGEVALVTGAEPADVERMFDEALAIAALEESETDQPAQEAAEPEQASEGQAKRRSVLISFKDRVIKLLLESS